MKKHLFALAGVLTLATAAQAQTFSLLVPESAIQAITGQSDAQPEDIAVDATGRIFVADEQGNTERIIRFDSNGTNGVLVADEAAIIAAVELVNGTASYTATTIRDMGIAADGDLIVVADSGSPETGIVLSILPNSPFTITVLSCAVDAGASPVEGFGVMAMIGNTAYIALNDGFGAAEDAIYTFDTNASGAPNIAPVNVVSEASLNTAFGVTGAATNPLNLGPITASGTNLYLADSNGSGTSDNIVVINTLTNTASSLRTKAQIQTDLGISDDLGYVGLAVVGGNLYANNTFGAGSALDAMIRIPVAGGAATLIPFATINTQLLTEGDTSFARMALDTTNNRIVIANQGDASASGGREGIVSFTNFTAVSDWAMY